MVYAAGGGEGCGQSGQNTDDQLDDELPEILLTVIHRNHSGIHFCVRHYVRYGLLDELLNKLVDDFFHCCNCFYC